MSNIPKTKKRSWNGELSAMSKMWNLLEPMHWAQRERVLAWLKERAKVDFGPGPEVEQVRETLHDLVMRKETEAAQVGNNASGTRLR
jgi:hypothetical protein